MDAPRSTILRRAARVILIDGADQVLYLDAREPGTGRRFWVMPGGGLGEGETFAGAAIREAEEETGLEIELGPCVWTRRHRHVWDGSMAEQYERFYVATVDAVSPELDAPVRDDYVVGYRWWSQAEIQSSTDDFAPRAIGQLLPPILQRDFPAAPIDCGV